MELEEQLGLDRPRVEDAAPAHPEAVPEPAGLILPFDTSGIQTQSAQTQAVMALAYPSRASRALDYLRLAAARGVQPHRLAGSALHALDARARADLDALNLRSIMGTRF